MENIESTLVQQTVLEEGLCTGSGFGLLDIMDTTRERSYTNISFLLWWVDFGWLAGAHQATHSLSLFNRTGEIK